MKLGAFELNEPIPELHDPHVIAMLRPWVDIGSVGSLVLAWLETHYQAKELGKLARPGDFFDFTRYRPTMYIQDGQRLMSIPNTTATYARAESNDFIFLHLLEPHNHGEDYVDSVLEIMNKFNAKSYCLLGSMYDYMPHTRPLIVTGSLGNKTPQEMSKMNIRRSNYQGPTTIASLVSQIAGPKGVEILSLIVHLPQYTQRQTCRRCRARHSRPRLGWDTSRLDRMWSGAEK